MTMREFRLPDLGEGLTESELVEWHVAPGDTVALNQTIADVETAKAIVQLPSPVAGVVRELLAEPGATVAVGAVIVRLEVADGAGIEPVAEPVADASSPAAASDLAPAATRNAVLVGYGPKVETGARPTRKPRTFRERAAAAPSPTRVSTHAVSSIALAAPPVRKLAHELGIDLARLHGSGEGGMIVRADVTRAADDQATTASATPASDRALASPSGETRVLIRGIRKATAQAMVASAFTAPHVTEFLTVDVTRSTEFLERMTASGTRVSLLGLVSKAVCLAMVQSPTLNARWDDAAGEIIQYSAVHLGIAVATDRGLMVPCLRSAEQLSLPQLTEQIAALAGSARSAELSPEHLRGSTFTISNIGVFGIDAGTPILNPGEAGILAMGAVRRQPWEHAGEVALREVMTLSLSFDHRLVDGEQGARFLTAVGRLLTDPASVMALV